MKAGYLSPITTARLHSFTEPTADDPNPYKSTRKSHWWRLYHATSNGHFYKCHYCGRKARRENIEGVGPCA